MCGTRPKGWFAGRIGSDNNKEDIKLNTNNSNDTNSSKDNDESKSSKRSDENNKQE